MLKLALVLVCLPGLGRAFGGTQSTWLGGTLPWDTVPYFEADPQLLFSAGSGTPAAGLGLDLGLTDKWMLQGSWVRPVEEGVSQGRVAVRGRSTGDILGLSGALFASAALPEAASVTFDYGLILAFELEGHSLAANYVRGAGSNSDKQSLRAGYWSPYVLYAVRLGIEGGLNPWPEPSWWLPQIAFNLPGDVSFDLGTRFDADGNGTWRLQSRLSYQLFPSP